METTPRTWTLGEIANLLGGTLNGSPEIVISRPVPAGSNDSHGITFAETSEYLQKIETTSVGAVLVPHDAPKLMLPTISVDRPREAFGRLLAMFQRPLPIEHGIHPTAVVSPLAEVAATASIGAYAVIEQGAVIGEGTRVYPFAYIGEDCVLGADVTIFPHAVLYQSVQIGDHSIVHAGAVLGADGFGFVWDSPKRSRRIKVPQVGGVAIGAYAEIGALTAVDRATAGDTVLETGVKLDNLVQIGHNSSIGEHTVIAGQTAVGGSATVGKRNEIGGQVAVSDHVVMGNDIYLAGRTGVAKDLMEPGVYWGVPATPIVTAKRVNSLTYKLPDLNRRLRELEAKLADLEGKIQ